MWEGTEKGVLQIALDNFYKNQQLGNSQHLNVVPLPIKQPPAKTPIVFCGFNPSYTEAVRRKEGTKLEWGNNKEFDKWIENNDANKTQENGHYPVYFKGLEEIHKKLCEAFKIESNFFHVDIYPIRRKDSKKMKEFLNKNEKIAKIMNEEFKKMLQALYFSLMFINSIKASEEMKEILNYDRCSEDRYNVFSNNDARRAIIHYSGMISSTRNIDKFNKQRLIEDVKKTTNEEDIKFD